MSEELDGDLRDLLNQLDGDDEFTPDVADDIPDDSYDIPDEIMASDDDIIVSDDEIISDDDPVINMVSPDDGIVMRPIDELTNIADKRVFDTEIPAIKTVNEEQSVEIGKYLDKIDEVTDEVLQACRADRQETQDVINMMRNQCDMAHKNGSHPSKMYVEGLIKAVEVKTNINTNAIKMMESIAKMIAATKAGMIMQNNNLTVSGAELDDILSRQGPSEDLD